MGPARRAGSTPPATVAGNERTAGNKREAGNQKPGSEKKPGNEKGRQSAGPFPEHGGRASAAGASAYRRRLN